MIFSPWLHSSPFEERSSFTRVLLNCIAFANFAIISSLKKQYLKERARMNSKLPVIWKRWGELVFGLTRICISDVNPCSENVESRRLKELMVFSPLDFPKRQLMKDSEDFSARVMPKWNNLPWLFKEVSIAFVTSTSLLKVLLETLQ